MKITVREARSEEYPAVASLTLKAYLEYQDRFGPEWWSRYSERLADVETRAEEAIILVGAQSTRLVGAAALYPNSEDERVDWPRDWAVIKRLAVHPDARRRGIGRLLVEGCIGRAGGLGAPVIALRTIDFMHPAVSLYRSLGFEFLPQYRTMRPGAEITAWALLLGDGAPAAGGR